MAVTYSQNGVIVRQDTTWLASNRLYADYSSNTNKGCFTPSFNLADARIIEENIVFKEDKWTWNQTQWNCSGGQWLSTDSSKFNGIAVYLWADKIEFDSKDGLEEYVNGISYDFSKIVRKNIVYDKNSGVATCKIYYDDALVCTFTKIISDLYFFNGCGYSLMGNRNYVLCDSGYIDLNKSYIRIDGKLVWGVDNLKKDEAVIGGKTYRTVKMPDGKIWMAENLDFKFCNIGGSGTPTTANAWYYNNDETTYGWNGYKCGLLYNWYACKLLNDNRSELVPGWHVPTNDEWTALATSVGGTATAGAKLKASNVSWASSWSGTDDYGFGVLPSGYYSSSNFSSIGSSATFWSVTEGGNGAYFSDFNTSATMNQGTDYKYVGYSLRLIRDT